MKVGNWRPENREDYLDDVLGFVPTLKYLRLSHRCVSEEFFWKYLSGRPSVRYGPPPANLRAFPLETLRFDYQKVSLQEEGKQFAIEPWMVIIAFIKRLSCLHTFIVDEALGWWSNKRTKDRLRLLRWVLGHQALLRGSNSKVSVIVTSKNIAVGNR